MICSTSFPLRNKSALSNCVPASESTAGAVANNAAAVTKAATVTNDRSDCHGRTSVVDSTKINVIAPWEEVTQL